MASVAPKYFKTATTKAGGSKATFSKKGGHQAISSKKGNVVAITFGDPTKRKRSVKNRQGGHRASRIKFEIAEADLKRQDEWSKAAARLMLE